MKPKPVEDKYVIRLFQRDKDFAGLVQLRMDIEAVDQAGNELDEAAVIETLNWPGHDPQKDRWVIESPENPAKLVGHAWARMQSQERTIVYVAIHPEWRRNGLGSVLLDRALIRAREQGAKHVTAAVDIKNNGAREFLLHHGFNQAGDNRFMQAPAGIPLAEPHWPTGYTVRNYAEVRDLSTLVKAFARSYGDMWGHRENTRGAMNEDYLAKRMEQSPERYIPEGIFIAFGPDGEIAGVCMGILGAKAEGDNEVQTKTVDAPGVIPEHRHLRLQRPLALTAMRWLQGYGPGPIDLESYGDKEEAIEIYREIGFVLQEHYTEYRRDPG
jgi:ribosomal protein S18 acetylase RimI-like enzyme